MEHDAKLAAAKRKYSYVYLGAKILALIEDHPDLFSCKAKMVIQTLLNDIDKQRRYWMKDLRHLLGHTERTIRVSKDFLKRENLLVEDERSIRFSEKKSQEYDSKIKELIREYSADYERRKKANSKEKYTIDSSLEELHQIERGMLDE